ncbi:MAG: dolichyl-phosphate beta-glucosyltransferase [Flexilinea sp.]
MNSEILLSIILPAYNEEERLPECMEKVAQFVADQKFPVEVLIIENGSRDNTLELAKKFTEEFSWLRVFKEDKPGKGRAVRRGMLESRGQYRFFADVDFSMPIEEISHFLPPFLSGYDIAIGSREGKGAIRYNEPAFRHITGRVFNWVVRIMAVHGVQDTQCGFKCFSAEAATKLFSVQLLDGWAFDAEVLFIAQHYGFKILEVPVRWYYDGHSKISVIRDSWKMFKELLQIRKNYYSGCYKIDQ